jgi:hypothetical protein
MNDRRKPNGFHSKRAMGVEPTTYTLATCRSSAELRPHFTPEREGLEPYTRGCRPVSNRRQSLTGSLSKRKKEVPTPTPVGAHPFRAEPGSQPVLLPCGSRRSRPSVPCEDPNAFQAWPAPSRFNFHCGGWRCRPPAPRDAHRFSKPRRPPGRFTHLLDHEPVPSSRCERSALPSSCSSPSPCCSHRPSTACRACTPPVPPVASSSCDA